jgi:hypothetical protein
MCNWVIYYWDTCKHQYGDKYIRICQKVKREGGLKCDPLDPDRKRHMYALCPECRERNRQAANEQAAHARVQQEYQEKEMLEKYGTGTGFGGGFGVYAPGYGGAFSAYGGGYGDNVSYGSQPGYGDQAAYRGFGGQQSYGAPSYGGQGGYAGQGGYGGYRSQGGYGSYGAYGDGGNGGYGSYYGYGA